jgi:hypothetical protein
MIEGLKLSIGSLELQGLCDARVQYHTDKATFFENEVKRLAPVMAEMANEAQSQGKFSNSNSMTDSFEQKTAHHKDRATYFKFLANHLIAGESYRLSLEDLRILEIVKGY